MVSIHKKIANRSAQAATISIHKKTVAREHMVSIHSVHIHPARRAMQNTARASNPMQVKQTQARIVRQMQL